MMSEDVRSERWQRYYQAHEGRPPRPLLLQALSFFEDVLDEKYALDLGCGNGIETIALLERGWHVTAIDAETSAIEHLNANLAPEHSNRLSTQVAAFHELEFPSVHFIHASLSLPFCYPDVFDTVWNNIKSSLKPKGIFVGHLFGDRDSWKDNDTMTFHAVDEARALLEPFKVLTFQEIEEERPLSTGGMKQWHIFEVIAQQPMSANRL